MGIIENLQNRSNGQCELCSSKDGLSMYEIPPIKKGSEDGAIILCQTCLDQINQPQTIQANHWRCLNESMWSEHQPVQVMTWRMLNLVNEPWAREL